MRAPERRLAAAAPARALATLALAALAALALAGCGARTPAVPPGLVALADAPVLPGQSVGELRLGVTTLGEAVARYGAGRPAVQVADEYAIELSYGEAALLFMATPACHAVMDRAAMAAIVKALRSSGRLDPAQAACEGALLHSLSFTAPPGREQSFFRGTVNGRVGIGSPLPEVLSQLGPSHRVGGLWIAGDGPDDGGLERYDYRDGLAVYVGNAPAGPQKGHLAVRRLAIFAVE